MADDTISRQDGIEAIHTWDKFGVDALGRVVLWHEGLEPYVHLRDVVRVIENLPSTQPEITLESAIDYLHSIGWMQEHDRIMTESAQPENMRKGEPMNDLISRQAALDAIEKAATKECARWVIKEIPPVDAVPVVHAHNESETGFLCSACRFGDFGQFNHGGKYTPNFCPNCGAKMDGGE